MLRNGLPQIWLGPCCIFVPPKFKGVLFNPWQCTFEAYHEGRIVALVDWTCLYQCMMHPIGRKVFREKFGSFPGQWLHEAVFP